MPYPNDWSAETVAALISGLLGTSTAENKSFGDASIDSNTEQNFAVIHRQSRKKKAVQNLAANFTDEVAAQLDGILRQMKAGENLKAQLQKQLEKAQQEFDRLLEMSLELDESTPFLDDKLRKLSGKIKILKANIAESTDGKGEDEEATKQLTAQDLLIKEYDDILTARIIEKVIVHSRQEIEIYFIGGYTQKIDLI